MNNIIINSISNEKVVAEKRAPRLKKTILTSALSFGVMLGSIDSGFCMKRKKKNPQQQTMSSKECQQPVDFPSQLKVGNKKAAHVSGTKNKDEREPEKKQKKQKKNIQEKINFVSRFDILSQKNDPNHNNEIENNKIYSSSNQNNITQQKTMINQPKMQQPMIDMDMLKKLENNIQNKSQSQSDEDNSHNTNHIKARLYSKVLESKEYFSSTLHYFARTSYYIPPNALVSDINKNFLPGLENSIDKKISELVLEYEQDSSLKPEELEQSEASRKMYGYHLVCLQKHLLNSERNRVFDQKNSELSALFRAYIDHVLNDCLMLTPSDPGM